MKTSTTTTKEFSKDEIITALMETYGLVFDEAHLAPAFHTEQEPSQYPSDCINIDVFDGVTLTYKEKS